MLEDGECAVLMRPELHSWLKVADMAQGSDLIPAGDQHRQPHEVKILQAIWVKGPRSQSIEAAQEQSGRLFFCPLVGFDQ